MCDCPPAKVGLAGRQTSFGGTGGHPSVTIQTPNTFDSDLLYPLVLILPGRGYTGAAVQTIIKQDDLKNLGSGCFVLAPTGATDPSGGVTSFNASSACCWFGTGAPDDVTYLAGLITAAQAAYPIDPRKIAAVGFSTGAFMAHRLAVERSDLLTGIIGINGYYPSVDGTGWTPANRVHVTVIGSTADTAVLYAGDPAGTTVTDVPVGAYPGAVSTTNFWAANNGSSATLTAVDTQDFDSNTAGSETSRSRDAAQTAGATRELWTMTGSTHQPNFNANFGDAIKARLLTYWSSFR